MAGLGGFMGYGLGGINWDATALGVMLGGHLHATFTLITIIFIICVSCTITSFKEIPLQLLESDEYRQLQEQQKVRSSNCQFVVLLKVTWTSIYRVTFTCHFDSIDVSETFLEEKFSIQGIQFVACLATCYFVVWRVSCYSWNRYRYPSKRRRTIRRNTRKSPRTSVFLTARWTMIRKLLPRRM